MNEEKRLTHCIWADGTSQQDYELFGDAVTFYTTFKTNQYLMFFAAFCGVNHHRRTVFFASAFIKNESKDSFIWLFDRFKDCMGTYISNFLSVTKCCLLF